jgi:hypothetical protein
MGNRSKTFALVLILMMAISYVGLLTVKPASAQTIPTPSVPQFTVQNIVYTSYIAPTYTINPYTGQNETTSSGGQVNIQTIEFTIKNQPFAPYTDSSGNYIGLYYNFRFKGHYGDEWTYYPFNPDGLTPHSYGGYSGMGDFIYYSASNSDDTVISINLDTLTEYPTGTQPIPDGSLVDFQVQSQIGHIENIPSGLLAGDFYNFTGQSSNWSNTQTLTINYDSNSTTSATSPSTTLSPSPTSTPSIPELSCFVIVPLLLSVFSVAIASRHRKTANLSK